MTISVSKRKPPMPDQDTPEAGAGSPPTPEERADKAVKDAYGFNSNIPVHPEVCKAIGRAIRDFAGRCFVTGNPWNTDTRPEGKPCPCESCAAIRAAVAAENDRCAKVIRAVEPVNGWGNETQINRIWADGFQEGKRVAAAAIRAGVTP
jgi:hypothetical protein